MDNGRVALPGRAARRRSAVVAVLLAVSACTPPGLPPPIAAGTGVTTAVAPRPAGTVVIGMDAAPTGFNPHQIADAGPVETAVTGLVLPSVSTVGADGSRGMNSDVVVSAAVTSTDPYVVTYKINAAASWSDGTPVTADDFSYLRDQLLTQPGTVDPAPYRLITAIRSLDAGKTVQVQFSSPFPGWAALFSPLLPSHILKDSPGGWAGGLAGGIPVSAGRYKVRTVDTTTGDITLVRNDKYWGSQPGPASVVLRAGTAAALTAALRRGDVQAIYIRPGTADETALDAAVPAADRRRVAMAATVQLVFDTAAGATSSSLVRRAVAAALDLPALRSLIGAGRADSLVPVPSLVALPIGVSARAPVGASPPVVGGDQATADRLLTEAGWASGGVYRRRNGGVLRLTLAYPAGDTRLRDAVAGIQSQLGAVGIEVDLVRLTGAEIGTRLTAGTVSLALLTVPRTPDDPTAVASQFGCPPPAATGAAPPAQAVRTGNLSGYCLVNPTSAELLDGAIPPTLDAVLWADLPVLPIGQPSGVFATGPGLAGVMAGAGPGWTFSGPLAGLPSWPAG